jgi:hypothetical protein
MYTDSTFTHLAENKIGFGRAGHALTRTKKKVGQKKRCDEGECMEYSSSNSSAVTRTGKKIGPKRPEKTV